MTSNPERKWTKKKKYAKTPEQKAKAEQMLKALTMKKSVKPEVRTLTDHTSRDNWFPGAGGLMVHSICCDPDQADRMYVGISVAGMFRTDDGRASWQPKNKNVRADF